jgi:hypothetical protein
LETSLDYIMSTRKACYLVPMFRTKEIPSNFKYQLCKSFSPK